MLQIEGLHVVVEGSLILRNVSLAVEPGRIVSLVGRNGAGKSTTLRTIMGYRRPNAGRIEFRGHDLTTLRTHAIARLGIGFAPEDSGIFGDLSVVENIEIATWSRLTPRSSAERVERALAVFPRLREYGARGGTRISGGERKMLSIARALALDPELLLLDEPFEGLSPAIIPQVRESIGAIARLGCGILLAESNIHHVPPETSRLYVLERGEIIYAGPPVEVGRSAVAMGVIGGRPTG